MCIYLNDISGTVLSWFSSYLTDRRHCPGFCSLHLLFSLYPTPLSAGNQNYLYAADTQVYISLATSDASRYLSHVNDCIQYIVFLLTDNKLRLTVDTTEFLINGPVQRRKLDGVFPICILRQNVTLATTVWNLSMTFGQHFNFRQHISETSRCCFFFIISAIIAAFAGTHRFNMSRIAWQG